MMDMFSALLGKSLSGGGGSEPVLVSKSISANGIYDPADDNADGFSSVTVNVPNTYTAADEGKVVSNGELVAQTSDTVTQNGTVNTTLISSLIVNVSGGTGTAVKLTITDSHITINDLYLINTGTYIYLFGQVYYRSSDPSVWIFGVPEGFDLTAIGTHKYGYVINAAYGTCQSKQSGVNASNRTVTAYCYGGATTLVFQCWEIAS